MRWIFLSFIVVGAWAQKPGTVLTETVGTSAFQVVTSREVKASKLLADAMRSDLKAVLMESSADDVNATLFEIAIFRESQGLAAVKISPEDLQLTLSLVKGRLQNQPEWKKLEVGDDELKRWVERKKVAMAFLDLKSNSLTSIVTDSEIQEYYEKNRVKFGSTPLSEQKETIRQYLRQESRKQRIQDWLAALKVKYQVRNDQAESKSGNK